VIIIQSLLSFCNSIIHGDIWVCLGQRAHMTSWQLNERFLSGRCHSGPFLVTLREISNNPDIGSYQPSPTDGCFDDNCGQWIYKSHLIGFIRTEWDLSALVGWVSHSRNVLSWFLALGMAHCILTQCPHHGKTEGNSVVHTDLLTSSLCYSNILTLLSSNMVERSPKNSQTRNEASTNSSTTPLFEGHIRVLCSFHFSFFYSHVLLKSEIAFSS
jgi:hypothetical protein